MEADKTKPWGQVCLVFVSFFLIVYLCGCAGKTSVLKPLETKQHFYSVEISEGNSTVNVPADVKQEFLQYLETFIYEDGEFQKGRDLSIKYGFTQYNRGNQFTRWLSGGIGGAGKGTVTIEAKFINQTDQELAIIQVEGEISSGGLGGGFEYALFQCAKAIAKYTMRNFK